MKRCICVLLALTAALLWMNCALGETKAPLPASRYSLTLPDGLEYDGPGGSVVPGDDAQYVYVSKPMGLEVEFFCYENSAGASLDDFFNALLENNEDVFRTEVNGIDMIGYRKTDPDEAPEEGMKCIGYFFTEGKLIQEVCFWYANQNAANMTAEIISSITDKD